MKNGILFKVKVSDEDMKTLNIEPHKFLGSGITQSDPEMSRSPMCDDCSSYSAEVSNLKITR